MLVLCFNLLSFGGRELSSKYSQRSANAPAFGEHPALSVHAEPTSAEGLDSQAAERATRRFLPLAPHLQCGGDAAVHMCL